MPILRFRGSAVSNKFFLCFESDLFLLFICRPEAFMTPFACCSLKTMRRFLLERKRQKETLSKS